jgi:transposase
MNSDELLEVIEAKYSALEIYFDERTRRIWGAVEARSLGHGGITRVSQATGMSRSTIRLGMVELEQMNQAEGTVLALGSNRKAGGGRKRLTTTDDSLLEDLEGLIEPGTRGDPESPLKWTTQSTHKLAERLQGMGHQVSPRSVYNLLREQGYSLQSNRKTHEGNGHVDRDEQFQHISQRVAQQQQAGQPVISVDAKKRELIGEFYNGGNEWRPKQDPRPVNAYDFVDQELGKVIPYGVYDLTLNQGWVNVGIDHNTAEFAVATIRQWWYEMGTPLYPEATELLITADCGGSNSYRSRLWKAELQILGDELGLTIEVCHFPPGTSKWNKIEHRMFSQISKNWRGQPLTSRAMVVHLIGQTTTITGLMIQAELDENLYEKGIEISEDEFNEIAIERDEFHGEWNYRILPRELSNNG